MVIARKLRRAERKFRTVRIKVRKFRTVRIKVVKIFAPCETPSWHMSGISHSPNQFSHGAKQLAKKISSAKQLPKVGELAKQLPKRWINLRKSVQVAKIQNPNSHGYCSWCEMVSHSANHPSATRVPSPQVAKRFRTMRKISQSVNSSAKIKTWCENFAPWNLKCEKSFPRCKIFFLKCENDQLSFKPIFKHPRLCFSFLKAISTSERVFKRVTIQILPSISIWSLRNMH